MDTKLYEFAKGLAEDSCDNTQRCLDAYNAASPHDYNRIRNLLLARSWVRAARKNLTLAAHEAGIGIALRLDELLKVHGMSALALSQALGVSHTTVGDWLNGAEPRARHLLRIAQYFKVPVVEPQPRTLKPLRARAVKGARK